MDIGARRVFRLSLTTAITLALAYSLNMNLPYMAPLFAFMLAAPPKPPVGLKGLLGLLLVLAIILSVGLLLTPILQEYPSTGLMLVLVGLFIANYVSLNLGKGSVGTFMVVGIAMISMIGQVSSALAAALIAELLVSVALGIVTLWVVYPLFPEDDGPAPQPPPPAALQTSWFAARATLIVFPAFMLGLTNPTAYTPIVMKSAALGQQVTDTAAKAAGRELLGSTFLAGLFAILFWFGLKLHPTLWMFFLWTLAFAVFCTAKFYGVLPSRYAPTFWLNVFVTLLILVGPAVADSANGKDVYAAFFVRLGLFIGVTLYAWLALAFLDWLRNRHTYRRGATP
ncbi:MAG: DUF2955 domain-containing protein [Pseudomonadota bacterium]